MTHSSFFPQSPFVLLASFASSSATLSAAPTPKFSTIPALLSAICVLLTNASSSIANSIASANAVWSSIFASSSNAACRGSSISSRQSSITRRASSAPRMVRLRWRRSKAFPRRRKRRWRVREVSTKFLRRRRRYGLVPPEEWNVATRESREWISESSVEGEPGGGGQRAS